MRSISSASPPAVGKYSSGWPKCPQRASAASRPMRCENHWDLTKLLIDVPLAPRCSASRTTGRAPGLYAAPEQLRELLDLVLGEERRDLLADRVPGLGRGEELVGDLVEVGEMLRAELLEAPGLEALFGQRRVGLELVREGLLGRGDLEVRLPVQVGPHLTPRGRAKYRPADVRLDQPGKVEMERGNLGVGAGVGEVDRMPYAAAAQRLAGIELPAEEGVDGERQRAQMLDLGRRHEAGLHRIAIVQGCVRVIGNATGLRSHANAAHEQVPVLDRGL